MLKSDRRTGHTVAHANCEISKLERTLFKSKLEMESL